MKSILSIAALSLTMTLVGCESTQDSAAPGAMSENCCGSCSDTCSSEKANMGTMGESCGSKADCASSCSENANMGAMGESCSTKADCGSACGSACPVTGK